ncbi:Ataxin-7-like protein 1 [Camponotus floridanus]|uniref:Ataxin-7-like protein 1 n=1 Tax=Camponotus floridanus TaxID=104421 RepID=E2AAZ2_CAMFO|nr:Ataxin-7-like protein 1 [Camponotus floridanus]
MSGSDSPTFFHGQPWSSWIERIGRDKPLSDEETEVQPSSSVTRLSAEDIDLYGFCPERDDFYGVVCEICNAIVKPQAFIQHMECRHPSGTASFPPPSNPVVKPPAKTPFCKVSKLKKTTNQLPTPSSSSIPTASGAKLNHTIVKRTTDQANLSASDRSLLKDREYDPDRHCGVWNEETGKPCTRSLTCKAHTVSLRRTVIGRSKTFDKLLAEHRAAKEQPNSGSNRQPTKMTVSGTITVASTVTVAVAAASSLNNPLTPNTPVSIAEPEAPSSPPVLSLPDTYPLPKAVDLLYRCLAPHGSTKPVRHGFFWAFKRHLLRDLRFLLYESSTLLFF